MNVPRWCYRASMRLRSLLRGDALDRDLDDELQFHLERLVQANLARGLSPESARREALLSIGGVEQRKEECRDARRVRWAGDLLQDVRYAARTLRRAPVFAAASILTLTLGMIYIQLTSWIIKHTTETKIWGEFNLEDKTPLLAWSNVARSTRSCR